MGVSIYAARACCYGFWLQVCKLAYKERNTFVLFVLETTRHSQLATASYAGLESGLVFASLFDTEAILHACENMKTEIKVGS